MFETILCATDGSENGTRGLAVARQLTDEHGASLRVVHVVVELPGGLSLHANEDHILLALKARVSALRRHGVDASLHVIRGGTIASLAHVIADTATSVGADVIVVGTRGCSPLAGAARQALTGRLLHVAACPVLAVPPAAGHNAHSAPDPAGERAAAAA